MSTYIFTHRPNGLYGYSYVHPVAHVHLKLDRLINGRYYTAEQQRRAAAGQQAFHYSTGHAYFQYLRFALANVWSISQLPSSNPKTLDFIFSRRDLWPLPRIQPRKDDKVCTSCL